ncbi:hypothetical protein SUGI_1474470 [Cryptomeria japonica]|uniref:Uncharacterized protein n=1 Tax=Cryptomeria japonica TaxID=3369 RepID=A0AAD3NTS3_CRYJA|nr:hypothetical protein SUGI_1469350 [Cryptomeria japonica]GLJ58761.1 hypothetical protein SUGI_1474470 [Cryptomeria japonica]
MYCSFTGPSVSTSQYEKGGPVLADRIYGIDQLPYPSISMKEDSPLRRIFRRTGGCIEHADVPSRPT